MHGGSIQHLHCYFSKSGKISLHLHVCTCMYTAVPYKHTHRKHVVSWNWKRKEKSSFMCICTAQQNSQCMNITLCVISVAVCSIDTGEPNSQRLTQGVPFYNKCKHRESNITQTLYLFALKLQFITGVEIRRTHSERLLTSQCLHYKV